MSTERDLLELAAKAAGMKFKGSPTNPDSYQTQQDDLPYGPRPWMPWNPLTDDGDALRLAVKLRLFVSVGRKQASAMPPDQASDDYFEAFEPVKGDPYAATRRAIVRAAAEIGKAMP
jgi:hypothetical protein